jgi:hypothetical protein
VLGLGWYGPHLPTVQPYSGPASPYWASKAFLGLLLPPEHPVWTATEEPAPIDLGDVTVPLRRPGWLVHGTHRDGIVRLLNHGSDRATKIAPGGLEDPHYARLAYSTHTAPQTGEHGARAVDNHAAVVGALGVVSRRRAIERITVTDRLVASAYSDELPAGPVRVATSSVVHREVEVRVHRVTAPAGTFLRDGGYAVAGSISPSGLNGPGWALATGHGGLTSAVIALAAGDVQERDDGTVRKAALGAISFAEGADAFGRYSAVPYLVWPVHRGGTSVHVAAFVLGRRRVDPDRVRAGVRVDLRPDAVLLAFEDGVTAVVRGPLPG